MANGSMTMNDIVDGIYFAVNNEGRSSHECSWAMIPQLDPKPKFGLLLHGGENQISIAGDHVPPVPSASHVLKMTIAKMLFVQQVFVNIPKHV